MICTVSLTILKPDGSPLAGESVSAKETQGFSTLERKWAI
jgi:hypothetical protein